MKTDPSARSCRLRCLPTRKMGALNFYAGQPRVGQAKGMLMERFKIDAVQAFTLLKPN
jgi:hypothetical protein